MVAAVEDNVAGDSNASMVYIPVGVFSVICPIVVALRFWTRLRKGGHLESDDWAITASLFFSLASSGVMIASCQYGYGQHAANLTTSNKIETLRYFWLCQITYKASINLTKCSIIFLYKRIFGGVKWFRLACWLVICCVAVYCVASVVATIFQCTPVSRAFNKSIEGTCINSGTFWYANAAFSISSDLVILILPMPLVWKLQIQRIQKIALVIVFALGGFVVITSCLRMTTIDIAATTTDQTFDIASTMWTIVEMNVAIVCACLPMLRPLIVKFFPRLMPKSSSNGNARGAGFGTHYGSNGYKLSNHSRAVDDHMATSHSHAVGGAGVGQSSLVPGSDQEDEWSGADGKDGITMTSIRKADPETGSEEYILHDDKQKQHPVSPLDRDRGMAIHKMVQYSVEYSKDGNNAPY
ncbi:hypothetical protein MKZ38_000557 [Zalerion maritima]|uniref:Rhodopsin domain-containing protein n=1 Tax=Zalerion maritima TaxID=339359 RepID=A0AAD5RFT8_9PEZI|nr:hypothetical protein MKZ38_000557 [Zalerion maritima]